MAHTPASRIRAYGKMKAAREVWFQANGPCRQCGSSERLELDHIEEGTKVSHTVWSWEPIKRAAELAKCQVLCYFCHKKKTARWLSQKSIGVPRPKTRKMTDRDVMKAVLMRQAGDSARKVAAKFGVCHGTILGLTDAVMQGKHFKSRGKLLGGPK